MVVHVCVGFVSPLVTAGVSGGDAEGLEEAALCRRLCTV